MTANSFESMLRRHAWELGLAVADLRKRVDEHVLASEHGDRLRSLVTLRDKLGPDGWGPHTVCMRWAHQRGWSGFTVHGHTAPTDVAWMPGPGLAWEIRRNIYDGQPLFYGPPGVVLLWALAQELDERGATFTGEQVCRECSGRGERIVALDQGLYVDPTFHVTCRRNGWMAIESPRDRPGTTVRMHASSVREERRRGNYDPRSVGNVYVPPTRMVVRPCPFCWTQRGRPETVSLEWLVRKLATAGDFRAEIGGWPARWQAQLDEWQTSGETHWRAQWWLAFAEWCHGKVPDQHQLARLLAMRMRERTRAKATTPAALRTEPAMDEREHRDRLAELIFTQLKERLGLSDRRDWTLLSISMTTFGVLRTATVWQNRRTPTFRLTALSRIVDDEIVEIIEANQS